MEVMLQTNRENNDGVINAIVTVAKLIPLVLVIILGVFLFNPSIFSAPHVGQAYWQVEHSLQKQ